MDHIVPLAVCPWLGNELANLELLPASLNIGKGASVGDRQVTLAERFREAGLIDAAMLARVEESRGKDQAQMAKYERREE